MNALYSENESNNTECNELESPVVLINRKSGDNQNTKRNSTVNEQVKLIKYILYNSINNIINIYNKKN